eukprot:jgi/Bigna1/90282/estExt_fgenesh1_pg.C_660096
MQAASSSWKPPRARPLYPRVRQPFRSEAKNGGGDVFNGLKGAETAAESNVSPQARFVGGRILAIASPSSLVGGHFGSESGGERAAIRPRQGAQRDRFSKEDHEYSRSLRWHDRDDGVYKYRRIPRSCFSNTAVERRFYDVANPLLFSANSEYLLSRFVGEIFCNRHMNMEKISAVGFDMDYTLALYRPDTFENLVFKEALKRLVNKKGYPEHITEYEYDPTYYVRGLHVDKNRGNILKLDRHKYVKGILSEAYEGLPHAATIPKGRYSDVIRSKRDLGWRTMMVIPELLHEIDRMESPLAQREYKAIRELYYQRASQEDHINELAVKLAYMEDEAKTIVSVAENIGIEEVEEGATQEDYKDALEMVHDDGGGGLPGRPSAIDTPTTYLQAKTTEKKQAYHEMYHPIWGQLFKTGLQNSIFASHVEKYACLYTSHASNFRFVSPTCNFRCMADLLPHDGLRRAVPNPLSRDKGDVKADNSI